MPLTDLQCRNAKVTGKDYTKADGDGLFLIIRSKGAKSWASDFIRKGERIKYNYGQYPALSLAGARLLHGVTKQLAEQGRKPDLFDNQQLKEALLSGRSLIEVEAEAGLLAQEQENAQRMTFGDVAAKFKTDWVDNNWKNPDKGFAPVRLHLLPKLSTVALDDIDAPLLRELFYEVREKKGTQAALHSHGWATRIFAYAIEHEWCTYNPAHAIKAARIGIKGKRSRWLATQEIRRYLVGLYQADCYRAYKLALHLLLMLALRKNELCGANWSEFDLDNSEWIIPAGRMKGKKNHCVFLPAQAIDILIELKRLGGESDWVLPMPTDCNRPMNGNNLDGAHAAAINSAKIDDYVIHDHRHTASTQLREQGHLPEVVETALSHAIPGMAGTYSHAQYKQQRLDMLQDWADFLDNTMNEKYVLSATFRKVA